MKTIYKVQVLFLSKEEGGRKLKPTDIYCPTIIIEGKHWGCRYDVKERTLEMISDNAPILKTIEEFSFYEGFRIVANGIVVSKVLVWPNIKSDLEKAIVSRLFTIGMDIDLAADDPFWETRNMPDVKEKLVEARKLWSKAIDSALDEAKKRRM